MKKASYISLFIFLLAINLIQAQEEKVTKFDIIAYGGIGYGIVQNENEPNYNLNSNSGDLLLNYRINQKFGIATGIGYNELSGNGFNSTGNFYHERTLVKIPLLATLNYPISDKLKMIANFGFYTQNVVKDEYSFLNLTQKDNYEGWNFGGQLGIGFLFEMFSCFSAGINYNGQTDFSKLETNSNQAVYNEQKLKNLNTIGIMVLAEL